MTEVAVLDVGESSAVLADPFHGLQRIVRRIAQPVGDALPIARRLGRIVERELIPALEVQGSRTRDERGTATRCSRSCHGRSAVNSRSFDGRR